MPLESVKLDDLSWADLSAVARDRIAGVSNGEWTLHAPVDPGITLIELFAAQLEQRLYWLNQPSDELTSALLSLLGIEPEPVAVARTVLSLSRLPGSGSSGSQVVKAGTVMERSGEDDPVQFRTTHSIVLLPTPGLEETRWRRARPGGQRPVRSQVKLLVGDEERTRDLQSGQLPCLLAAGGKPGETRVAIAIEMAEETGRFPPAALNDAPISLAFDLETPDGVNPEWLSERAKVPDEALQAVTGESGCDYRESLPVAPATRLQWSVSFGTPSDPFGCESETAVVSQVEDGTLGFRRSGVVRLFAGDLDQLAGKSVEVTHLVVVLRVLSMLATFTPLVRQIVPNAVLAEHRVHKRLCDGLADTRLREQVLAWATRRLPGNQLSLPLEPGAYPIPDSVELTLSERAFTPGSSDSSPVSAHWSTWRPVRDFRRLGPADRGFVVDRAARRLVFGDGLNGRIPVPLEDEPLMLVSLLETDDAAGRDFRLSYAGSITESIPVAATADVIQQALRLAHIDLARVVCTGGPLTEQPVAVDFSLMSSSKRGVPLLQAEGPVVAGCSLFQLSFDCGGGMAGNMPAGRSWQSIGDVEAVLGRNVVSAEGGEDAETLQQVTRRSKTDANRDLRAVTRSDIEELARQTQGVGIARTHAAVGLHPDHPGKPVPGAVTVFVVPGLPPSLRRFTERADGDDLTALRPDPGALQAVAARLNEARLITQEIFVRPAIYQEIGLSVVLAGNQSDLDVVRESVTHVLYEYLHPLYGGPLGVGWPFGAPLRQSELMRVLSQSLDSDLSVREVGIRHYTVQTGANAACPKGGEVGHFETCEEFAVQAHALVVLRSVKVSLASLPGRAGGLQ